MVRHDEIFRAAHDAKPLVLGDHADRVRIERTAGRVDDNRIHRTTKEVVLLVWRERGNAECGKLVAPIRVRIDGEQSRADLAQSSEDVHADVAATDQADRRALDRHVHAAQHAGKHVEVSLARRFGGVGHHAPLEPLIEVLERASAAVGHRPVSQVLPSGQEEPAARLYIREARDGEVEQLAIAWRADARVCRRMKHARSADNAT